MYLFVNSRGAYFVSQAQSFVLCVVLILKTEIKINIMDYDNNYVGLTLLTSMFTR